MLIDIFFVAVGGMEMRKIGVGLCVWIERREAKVSLGFFFLSVASVSWRSVSASLDDV